MFSITAVLLIIFIKMPVLVNDLPSIRIEDDASLREIPFTTVLRNVLVLPSYTGFKVSFAYAGLII